MSGIQRVCSRIAESHRFQMTIFTVIVLNAVVLGLDTYDTISREWGDTLFLLNAIFLGIFMVEILIRIAAYGSRPQDYFKDGWNVFDFVVVFAVVIPGVRENATLLRLVRLLRIVRVISIFPDLRVLVRGMVGALRPIASMALLIVLFLFTYGMVGVQLFGEELPERWDDIGTAVLTLFTVLTLEGWNEVLFAAQDVTQFAWVFFVSFVLIGAFLVINVLIAIVINAIDEARETEKTDQLQERLDLAAAGGQEPDRVALLVERVRGLRGSLEELELELEGLDEDPAGQTRDRDPPIR